MKHLIIICALSFSILNVAAQKINFSLSKEKLVTELDVALVAKNDLFYYVLLQRPQKKLFKLLKYDSKTSDLVESKEIELPEPTDTKVKNRHFIAVNDHVVLFYTIEDKKSTVLLTTELDSHLQRSQKVSRIDSAEFLLLNYRIETIDNGNKIAIIKTLDRSDGGQQRLQFIVVDTEAKILSKNMLVLPFNSELGKWNYLAIVKNNRFTFLSHDMKMPDDDKKNKGDYLVCYNLLENKLSYKKIEWPKAQCFRINLVLDKKNQINIVSLYSNLSRSTPQFDSYHDVQLHGAISMIYNENATELLETKSREITEALQKFNIARDYKDIYTLKNINMFEDGTIAVTCEPSIHIVTSGSTINHTISENINKYKDVIIFNITNVKSEEWINVFSKKQTMNITGTISNKFHSVFALATPKYVALFMNVNPKKIDKLFKQKNFLDLGKLKNYRQEGITRAFLIDSKGMVTVEQIPGLEGDLKIATNYPKIYLSPSRALLTDTKNKDGYFGIINLE